MKTKKSKIKPVRQSFLLGVLWDVVSIVEITFRICGWPLRQLGKLMHNCVKHHRALKSEGARLAISACFGLVLLAGVFAVEHFSDYFLWQFGIETAKAAGVCPIWEALAVAIRYRG